MSSNNSDYKDAPGSIKPNQLLVVSNHEEVNVEVENLPPVAIPEIIQQNQMEEQKESNNRLITISVDSNLNEPHETE